MNTSDQSRKPKHLCGGTRDCENDKEKLHECPCGFVDQCTCCDDCTEHCQQEAGYDAQVMEKA